MFKEIFEKLDTQASEEIHSAQLIALMEAHEILSDSMRQTCSGPHAVWAKLYHAREYIDGQVKENLERSES